MNIIITRMAVQSSDTLLAFFDFNLETDEYGTFEFKDFKLTNGSNGENYANPPQDQFTTAGGETKYKWLVGLPQELRMSLRDVALEKYSELVGNNETSFWMPLEQRGGGNAANSASEDNGW